jgi:two-component system nitrogen regulation sensor histidine kinase NtrY
MKARMRNRFRILAFVQVGLLVVSVLVLAWTVFNTDHFAVPAVVAVVIGLQIAALIRFTESHVDTLEEFFAAVNYEDFTQRFVSGDVDGELKDAFNRILDRFQDARAQREVQANYLEVVVRHVPVPLMAVKADGTLRLVNNPARRLTGMPSINHIDDLSQLDPDLPERIKAIEPGQQRLLHAQIREIPVELRVAVSEIRMGSGTERLYSIENLSGELTARESSAWRNLIRVLTHEIMNTLTPVSSLAQTCTTMIDQPDAADDVREAIETIARRSEGLMHFVSRYRELLKVPQPVMSDVRIATAFGDVTTLLGDQLTDVELETIIVPESLEVHADPQLLDQLLVNIVKNAIDAMHSTNDKILQLSAQLDYGRVIIRISDSGPGVPDDELDQVFIPFFTTKREGSGIGLSLSRQIMTSHGGEIAIKRRDDRTVVNLVF